jgi:molybdopterin-guanine dinucleotide biosynthesis protein A
VGRITDAIVEEPISPFWRRDTEHAVRADLALAAIVLAGGRSRRMGVDKAHVVVGGEPMLVRVVRSVGAAAAPLIVVAAADQSLPDLPAGIEVVRDARPDRGPLEGLRAGLRALAAREGLVEAAFLCATDMPLIVPELPLRLLALWREQRRSPALVVATQGLLQPLLGVYATAVLPEVEAQLETDDRSLKALVALVGAAVADEAALLGGVELAAADPRLESLVGVNTPEQLVSVEAMLAARSAR